MTDAVALAEVQARIMEAEARLAAAQAAQVPKPKVKPADPIMGTTEETYPGSSSYYYAFGGEPKGDWSGIKDLKSRMISDM